MHLAVAIVSIIAGVGVVAGICNRMHWPTPLVLLVVGVAVSYVPGVPTVRIDPELVLNGLLPPLLFAATAKLSLFDFRRDVTATLLMSVGLVVVTTASVGLVAWWLLPGATLAAGLAVGAVVAPPDAVATSAIGHRLGLPRKITSLLEKESLLNDATSLVLLGLAVTATTTSVGVGDVAFDIFRSVGGGVAVGAGVAAVLVVVRKHLEDPVLDTTLSFAAPYLAFLPAEEIKASGVLAVVITGLALAHLSPTLQNASSRLAEATNWRTIAFLLENAVFLLIGLQLPSLLSGARSSDLSGGTIVAVCAGVFLTTVLTRIVFVFVAREAFTFGTKKMRLAAWPLRGSTVIGWAGMRGVVTLAAALLLPESFVDRDVVLLVAFTVVAGTLLVQGLSLPWLARRLNLPRPDPAEDALQAAELTERSTRRGLRKLDELLDGTTGHAVPEDVIETLRHRATVRSNAAWERLGRPLEDLMTPSAMYSKLRTKMLAAEREEIVLARDTGAASDGVLRAALAAVDQEESMIERVEELEALTEDRELAPKRAEAPCIHLAEAPTSEGQPPEHECPDCLREGTTWVHLRRCLTCGAVGCCDSSPRRHAYLHFKATRHPVVRSAEPGEAWRWCWIDEVLG